jgi:hypothetical protein
MAMATLAKRLSDIYVVLRPWNLSMSSHSTDKELSYNVL